MTQKTAKQFSPELRERAVRMVQDREREGGTQWESIGAIAAKMGCSRETLRRRVRQEQRDAGQRPGLTTDERERIRALERTRPRTLTQGVSVATPIHRACRPVLWTTSIEARLMGQRDRKRRATRSGSDAFDQPMPAAKKGKRSSG